MLTTIHLALETIGAATLIVAIICFGIAYLTKEKDYCLLSSKLLMVTAFVWAINLIFEFLIGIYISAICTVICICLCAFFSKATINYAYGKYINE